MARKPSPVDVARALLVAAGLDVEAVFAQVAAAQAGAQVVVSPAPAQEKPVSDFVKNVIRERVLCAWLGNKCLDRDRKPHTFAPNGVGRYSHTSCAAGRATMQTLASEKPLFTVEDLFAGHVTAQVKVTGKGKDAKSAVSFTIAE